MWTKIITIVLIYTVHVVDGFVKKMGFRSRKYKPFCVRMCVYICAETIPKNGRIPFPT